MHFEQRPITVKISKNVYYKYHPKKENKSLIDMINEIDSPYRRKLKIMQVPGEGIMKLAERLYQLKNPTEDDYEYYKIKGYETICICGEEEYRECNKNG